MLYEDALLSGLHQEEEIRAIWTSLEQTSTRIAIFSDYLFADMSKVDIAKMSPFIPYSLYQAAIVQYRLFKRTGQPEYEQHVSSLKTIMTHFRERWWIAGKHQTHD